MVLHFASVQPSEAGVYICTCRNPQFTNSSRSEVIVTGEGGGSSCWPPTHKLGCRAEGSARGDPSPFPELARAGFPFLW